MEIENRETEQRNDPKDFSLPHFPPLPKIPLDPELLGRTEKAPHDPVGLIVDYLGRDEAIDLKILMEAIERGLILKALRRAGGNQKEAARILGLKYTTLNQKVKKHRIRFLRRVRLLDV